MKLPLFPEAGRLGPSFELLAGVPRAWDLRRGKGVKGVAQGAKAATGTYPGLTREPPGPLGHHGCHRARGLGCGEYPKVYGRDPPRGLGENHPCRRGRLGQYEGEWLRWGPRTRRGARTRLIGHGYSPCPTRLGKPRPAYPVAATTGGLGTTWGQGAGHPLPRPPDKHPTLRPPDRRGVLRLGPYPQGGSRAKPVSSQSASPCQGSPSPRGET